MRKITKKSEPKEWTKYRLTPGVKYQAKDFLRNSLLEEQGFICAYCMRRIPSKDENSNELSRIEHLKSQNKYPEKQLDYSNMVVCCPGAIDHNYHCDKSKGDFDVSFDLFSDQFISTILYRSKTGEIYSTNEKYSFEMNDVLNLNNRLLMRNRKAALDGVIKVLKKKGWTKTNITVFLKIWNNKRKNNKKGWEYLEYCGIVVWFLKQKLRTNQ